MEQEKHEEGTSRRKNQEEKTQLRKNIEKEHQRKIRKIRQNKKRH